MNSNFNGNAKSLGKKVSECFPFPNNIDLNGIYRSGNEFCVTYFLNDITRDSIVLASPHVFSFENNRYQKIAIEDVPENSQMILVRYQQTEPHLNFNELK